MPVLICDECRALVDGRLATCPECRHFVGYPNRRRAEDMRPALLRHYRTAVDNAAARGVADLLKQLEAALTAATATIAVSSKIAANMSLDNPYLGYHQALDENLRMKAEDLLHSHRLAADAKLHPGYEKDIMNAALSPDGRGVTAYGPVVLQLSDTTLERRASLLRENAYPFYERYSLGNAEAAEDRGWRATWADRALLGVAQLEPFLTPALPARALADLILTVGATRAEDRFIEVHVFDPIQLRNVVSATLAKPLTDAESIGEWAFASQSLARRGVAVWDSTTP